MKKAKPIDYIELQSWALAAECIAEKLLKKHRGNIKAIEKEKIFSPTGAKATHFNLKKEVLWSARWLKATNPQ